MKQNSLIKAFLVLGIVSALTFGSTTGNTSNQASAQNSEAVTVTKLQQQLDKLQQELGKVKQELSNTKKELAFVQKTNNFGIMLSIAIILLFYLLLQGYQVLFGVSKQQKQFIQQIKENIDVSQINTILDNQISQKLNNLNTTLDNQISQKINDLVEKVDNLSGNISSEGLISEIKNQGEKITTKITDISEALKNNNKEPENQKKPVETDIKSEANIDNLDKELTEEEKQVVENYEMGDDLSQLGTTTNVSLTEETLGKIRMSENPLPILEASSSGIYLIIKLNAGNYLVPDPTKTLNQHQMNSIKYLFELRNYQSESKNQKNFQIIKPAKVDPGNTDETWILQGKGILKFQ